MTLTDGGNLGLGVTPSAWSAYTAAQIRNGSIYGWSGGNSFVGVAANTFYGGSPAGYRYISSDFATEYYQFQGSHIWRTAPSGTAGNAIGFTQAMTLDASGRLLVGRTTNFAGEALQIDANGVGATVYSALIGNSSTSTSVYNVLRFNQGASGSATGMIGTGGSAVGNNAFANNFVVGTQTSNALVFATNDTERARITSGGDLLVGTTSSGGKLTVEQTGSNANGAIITNQTYNYQTLGLHNTATANDNLWVTFGTEASFTTRGSIDYNRAGGLTRYNTTSDYRAKDIIGPVTDPGAQIDALKVYSGKMHGATIERPMMIAHEAQQVAPYAVSGVKDEVNEDGTPKYQQMDHASLVPLLIAEIQSLRARVAQLEAK
jgi:hypothetical protein